jgi:hypothetical protein
MDQLPDTLLFHELISCIKNDINDLIKEKSELQKSVNELISLRDSLKTEILTLSVEVKDDEEVELLITDSVSPHLVVTTDDVTGKISLIDSSLSKPTETDLFLEAVYDLNEIEESEEFYEPTKTDLLLEAAYELNEIVEAEDIKLTNIEHKKNMTDFDSKIANLLHIPIVEGIDTFLEVSYELNEEDESVYV